MKTLYKVTISFQGTASLEIAADSLEAARQEAAELTLPDLARAGHLDVSSLKVAAREITPVSALRGEDDTSAEEAGPRRPRPSGWYRPL